MSKHMAITPDELIATVDEDTGAHGWFCPSSLHIRTFDAEQHPAQEQLWQRRRKEQPKAELEPTAIDRLFGQITGIDEVIKKALEADVGPRAAGESLSALVGAQKTIAETIAALAATRRP